MNGAVKSPRAPRTVLATRARSSDRGAALVEFALVAPVLFALVFGMIDFGVGISNQIAVRQGVREGARQAVVMAPDAATLADAVALTKERIGLDETTAVRLVVEAVGSTAAGEPGSELTACALVPMRSVSGLYSPMLDGRYISAEVTMRVEQELTWAESTTDGGDDAPGSEDWSWCGANV